MALARATCGGSDRGHHLQIGEQRAEPPQVARAKAITILAGSGR